MIRITDQKEEKNLVFCGKCKYYNGYSDCLKVENKVYERDHIRECYRHVSTYTLNKNNDCKSFEQKEPKKSIWSKLKFW